MLPLAPTLLRGGWGSEPPVRRSLMTHCACVPGQPGGCEPGRGVSYPRPGAGAPGGPSFRRNGEEAGGKRALSYFQFS